jgi:hypothetical protein
MGAWVVAAKRTDIESKVSKDNRLDQRRDKVQLIAVLNNQRCRKR